MLEISYRFLGLRAHDSLPVGDPSLPVSFRSKTDPATCVP
jgi:hypothetical protein